MTMHKKAKGSVGELRVAADLIKQGYAVFTELGDLSKVDLLVLDQQTGQVVKVQVKWRSCKNGVVQLANKKSGPNYSFKYRPHHYDVMAVYVPEKDTILYISFGSFGKSALAIRFENTKNNQNSGINWYEDYLNFKEALRGHT